MVQGRAQISSYGLKTTDEIGNGRLIMLEGNLAMANGTLTQGARDMQVTTPLGSDVLVLSGFSGREGIS
jgi:hypothetical protein